MTNSLGLYLHIPFCKKRCKYCSFYSSFATEEMVDCYTKTLIVKIREWGGGLKSRPIDTIYFGGGTPSLLNDRLPRILDAIRDSFYVRDNCEITLELNPEGNLEEILKNAKTAGVNRLSIGAQSGIDRELKLLGREHSADDIGKAVEKARKIGFGNVSLDLMLGLPNSDLSSLEKSLDYITRLEPEHISAYILKLERNTALWKNISDYDMPSDDEQADQYMLMCDYLRAKGFEHYEISNFCKKGFESRHNIKYWQLDEYLGIGPSAHSYLNGERFYYPNDLRGFINGNETVFDSLGGSAEEYVMLKLRLKSGFNIEELKKQFCPTLNDSFYKKIDLLGKNQLLCHDNGVLSLTEKGMLISNSIIAELLECIE